MMISVEEAYQLVLNNALDLRTEYVSLRNAINRYAATDWHADSDIPPFDRVMMDGIAIAYSDIERDLSQFTIEGIQRAGEAAKTLQNPGACIEVMTGACCPVHADTIIPYEDLQRGETSFTLNPTKVKRGQNIHRKGRDVRKSDVVLKRLTKITSSEIGVAASIGLHDIDVVALPKAIIISTGDELVDTHETPLPWQIRKSNVYVLQALLQEYGVQCAIHHVKDDLQSMRAILDNALQTNQIVILTGGVSKGIFDFVPQVMEELAVEKIFHRIAQKPGKPLWFGRREGTVVFALPGNPVSVYLCAIRYMLPWLRKSMGIDHDRSFVAELTADVKAFATLTHFIQVKLYLSEKGKMLASPVPGGGSGDYVNLVRADAFAEAEPDNNEVFPAGSMVKVYPFRNKMEV